MDLDSASADRPEMASNTGGSTFAPSIHKSYSDLLAAAEAKASVSAKPSGLVQSSSMDSIGSSKRAEIPNSLRRVGGFAELWPPHVYIREREGQVLGSGMVLKSDHVPANDLSASLEVHISGAPNFRKSRPFSIYAVGQPSVHGIRTILNFIGHKPVKWICLREEPVVYINNRSFVLRELDHPLRNMRDFQGISWRRLEEIEKRLKMEILKEASKNGGNVLIHHEDSLQVIRPYWESVTITSVKTQREIYDEFLKSEGYGIEYSRVPVTPMSNFSAKDVDHLVRTFSRLRKTAPDSSFIVNCQMGQGRSTLGSAFLYLLYLDLRRQECRARLESEATFLSDLKDLNLPPKKESYIRREPPEIYKLVRILDHGQQAKELTDIAIEAVGGVYNLKEELFEAMEVLENSRDEDAHMELIKQVSQSMDRYFLLICFAAYLIEVDDAQTNFSEFTFEEFLETHAGLLQFQKSLSRGELVPSQSCVVPSLGNERFIERRGSVLQSSTILKPNSFIPSKTMEELQIISGAPNFHKIAGFPIASLAQPSISGMVDVIESLRSESFDIEKIVWISLVVEPIVYLRNESFVLRDETHPFRRLREFSIGLPKQRLYQINKRLKNDILNELKANEGLVALHREVGPMKLKLVTEKFEFEEIQTQDEVFSGLVSHGFLSQYYHIPLLSDEIPSLACFDDFVSSVRPNLSKSMIIFNCEFGRGPSTMAMVMATLMLIRNTHANAVLSAGDLDMSSHSCFGLNKNPSSESIGVAPKALSDAAQRKSLSDFKGVLGLIRILKKGRLVKDEVDVAIERCGKVYNIRDAVFDQWLIYEKQRSGGDNEGYLAQSAAYLIRYQLLICFNSYLYELFLKKIESDVSFSQWMNSRPELNNWLEFCRSNPSIALKRGFSTSDGWSDVFESRSGNVLVPYSMLKCDYFPGCQNKKLFPAIEGAPNYRMINRFPVCGTAVPTEVGVMNVIREIFRQTLETKPIIFWINLREEPLLYINNRPFCLRDADEPVSNLVNTGINTRRVEGMEKQLKTDVLHEAASFSGKILLHDEADDGSLIAAWEEISSSNRSVKTCREMYTQSISATAANIDAPSEDFYYARIPITDEQAPLPETFDEIVDILRKTMDSKYQNAFFVFNCQMGRGRTTTGIVSACLWLWSSRKLISNRFFNGNIEDVFQDVNFVSRNGYKNGLSAEEDLKNKQEENLLNGDYKLITKLVRILPTGVRIKFEVDAILNHCSEMQNLRTAIYDLRVRAESAASFQMKQDSEHRAKCYLVRYFYLIAFHGYLQDAVRCNYAESFATWLKCRPEISSLLENFNLD